MLGLRTGIIFYKVGTYKEGGAVYVPRCVCLCVCVFPSGKHVSVGGGRIGTRLLDVMDDGGTGSCHFLLEGHRIVLTRFCRA